MEAQPLTCWRPTPEFAAEFAAPPYDVFDRKSASTYVKTHPQSFLAIDRPETSFAPDHDMYADDVYQKAQSLLAQRLHDATLTYDAENAYYVWRLESKGASQVGLVAGIAVADYEAGIVHQHEKTRTAKRNDRIKHIRITGAQTGPVLLAYKNHPKIDEIVAAAMATDPLYDFWDEALCHHRVWRIADTKTLTDLHALLETVSDAYIADGHHRAAAAVSICQESRSDALTKNTSNISDVFSINSKPKEYFLGVLFPANQLRVLPYNRVISDTAGLSQDEIISALQKQGFVCTPKDTVVDPGTQKHFGIYISNQWFELSLSEALAKKLKELSKENPAAYLDTSIVQDYILHPIFGVDDPTKDPRLSFVGGINAAARAANNAGAKGIAISLFATSVEELMDVADAGLLMPPKSTWFEPKLASGLFIRTI